MTFSRPIQHTEICLSDSIKGRMTVKKALQVFEGKMLFHNCTLSSKNNSLDYTSFLLCYTLEETLLGFIHLMARKDQKRTQE